MNFKEIYEARLAAQTPEEIKEQQEQTKRLSEAADLFAMKHSAGWGKVTAKMQEFIEEARRSCENNLSANPRIAHALQIRLQQRKAVVQGIHQYVDELIAWRALILNPDKENEE